MTQFTDSSLYDSAPRARRRSILLRGIEVWLVISVIEVLHGVARIAVLQPLVGEFRARQIAVFSGSALILATTFVFRRWLDMRSSGECLMVGLAWVALMLAFEFVLGRMVLDLSWEKIFSDYDLIRGGLMPIGLVVMFLSPLIVFRFRG